MPMSCLLTSLNYSISTFFKDKIFKVKITEHKMINLGSLNSKVFLSSQISPTDFSLQSFKADCQTDDNKDYINIWHLRSGKTVYFGEIGGKE